MATGAAQWGATRFTLAPSAHDVVATGSPDLHAVTTMGGVYRFVSDSGLAAFGWRSEDLLGTSEDSLVHPDDVLVVADARVEAARVPGFIVTTLWRFLCKSGG